MSELRSALQKAVLRTNNLQTQLSALQQEYQQALGAQAALAELFLPAGMTLQKAWDSNFKNLREEDEDEE